jgi:Glutaredoxin-like domain (DUF836)
MIYFYAIFVIQQKLALKIFQMTKLLNLYSTSHCHLCELAHSLLMNFSDDVALAIIDIAEDEKLLDAYSLRIPVLQRLDTNTELNWPFNATDINEFLKD